MLRLFEQLMLSQTIPQSSALFSAEFILYVRGVRESEVR